MTRKVRGHNAFKLGLGLGFDHLGKKFHYHIKTRLDQMTSVDF